MIEVLAHLFDAVCGQNPGHTWMPGGLLLPCCQRCTGLYVGAGLAALLHLWLRPKLDARFLRIHGAFLLFMAPFGFHWVAHGPVMRTITGVLFGFAVVTFLWLPVVGAFRGKGCWRGELPKTSNIQHPTSNIQHPTSNTQHPTSNTQHPTSNIQWGSFGGSLDVGGSMLDVGCFQRAWRGTRERVSRLLSRNRDARMAGGPPAPPALLSATWAYFCVLAAALALLPVTARSGGPFAAYMLSVLSIWGAFCFAALIAADLGLGLLAVFRWLLRLLSLHVIA